MALPLTSDYLNGDSVHWHKFVTGSQSIQRLIHFKVLVNIDIDMFIETLIVSVNA